MSINLGTGARIEERAFLVELIELYRDLTPLWQTRCKEYNDRVKRAEAYDTLLAKYHERHPDATLDDLKRRINTLRTNFRKELKKVLKSGKSGNVYASRAWHFEHLMFLADQEDNISSADFLDDTMDDMDVSQDQDSMISPAETPRRTRSKRKKPELEGGDEEESDSKRPFVDEDGFYQAKVWASEIRRMALDQQLLAKKAINDILFEGQMGNLSPNSVLINANISVATNSKSKPGKIAADNGKPNVGIEDKEENGKPNKGVKEEAKNEDYADLPTLADCVGVQD
ncbi:hypothetical protein CAPTEDRAFT_158394 [Capitella teleta]|uniref:MADF domain-containing protein n=1 Tax=Capitella teleta TaxID=283909 RepID=R7V845_CAPTE|nr:hypothetical protein CAPTEDRAFT_158394 [Capitella teleta]|eukprot:ELU14684.1 hypothetical protein CAPTEDRAFT_158394 [Capitella teleta]